MDRAEVIRRLKACEPELRALGVGALYLFGSYARDEARWDSDIDVFVDPADAEFARFDRFMGAYNAIGDALPGRDIGYGTRAGLSKYIRSAAEREAVRVF
ncbi:nucleotidyltransferase family protein [Jiella sp. M17.18]|uniref:nucleotidyltransferase family protein n=1 Tax=Jiella sp. M17.18 TaxID=3234247 RepID=UPI0034E03D5C